MVYNVRGGPLDTNVNKKIFSVVEKILNNVYINAIIIIALIILLGCDVSYYFYDESSISILIDIVILVFIILHLLFFLVKYPHNSFSIQCIQFREKTKRKSIGSRPEMENSEPTKKK